MTEEYGFSPNEITKENLANLSIKAAEAEELRISEVASIAEECALASADLFEGGMGIYEILSYFAEDIYSTYEPVDVIIENRERVRSFLKARNALGKAAFCDLYCEILKKQGIVVSESSFLSGDIPAESFAYVRSSFSDEAYDVFSQSFNDPRVSYKSSMREAAEAVFKGEAGYCLLPLEESGARLSSVASLLFKYDLKITDVTPVFGFDGSADMKYALVSKSFSVPPLSEGDDRYLEIRMRQEGSDELELLTVAASFSARIYRINTLYFDTADGKEPYFSIVFKTAGGDFSVFLTYLYLFCGGLTSVGIYKNLE